MNKVKEICIRQGIVQKELAALVGVSQPTVSDWFNNKKDPSGERLDKLALILGVSRAVILGYEEDAIQTEKAPTPDDARAEAKQLLESLSDDQYQAAVQYLQFLKAQEKKK